MELCLSQECAILGVILRALLARLVSQETKDNCRNSREYVQLLETSTGTLMTDPPWTEIETRTSGEGETAMRS